MPCQEQKRPLRGTVTASHKRTLLLHRPSCVLESKHHVYTRSFAPLLLALSHFQWLIKRRRSISAVHLPVWRQPLSTLLTDQDRLQLLEGDARAEMFATMIDITRNEASYTFTLGFPRVFLKASNILYYSAV